MRILVVDSDPGTRWILRKALKNHIVIEVISIEEAELILKNEVIHAVFTARYLPDGDSYNLIEKFSDIYFIIMTSNPIIENISLALKKGAYGYIKKPFDFKIIEEVIRDLEERIKYPKETETQLVLHNIHTIRAFKLIKRYTEEGTPFTVFGEEGVGKKSMVKAVLVQLKKPYIFISKHEELYGFIKSKEKGRFIVIEDINRLPLNTQKAIPKLITEGYLTYNIIFLLKEDPFKLLYEESVPENLFNLLTRKLIEIPPLRERKDEIPIIIENIRENLKKQNKNIPRISPEAMNALIRYHWPQNIKELKERIIQILSTDKPVIKYRDLPSEITMDSLEMGSFELLRKEIKKLLGKEKDLYNTVIGAVEKILLEEALSFTKGNQVKAAELIGIHRNTIRNKIKKLFGGKGYGS